MPPDPVSKHAPTAVHLPSGDVIVPAALFEQLAETLRQARAQLVATGGTYDQLDLVDATMASLGIAKQPHQP